jgi:hypothetical protein
MRDHKTASPGSISEIGIRLVNLRALCKTEARSSNVLAAARDIDSDLVLIRDAVPQEWKYTTVTAREEDRQSNHADPLFLRGKQHKYAELWVAEIWNHWRMLRITVNQILHQPDSMHTDHEALAAAIIKDMSEELCISVPSFENSPRRMMLIRALYVVAAAPQNDLDVRQYALEQIRRIGVEMGIRHAVLIADAMSELETQAGTQAPLRWLNCESIPLAAPY